MRKCGAPLRYAATMAGLAGIGLGSAGFHTTVRCGTCCSARLKKKRILIGKGNPVAAQVGMADDG